MKLLFVTLLTMSYSSMAAEVISAKLDDDQQNILVDVSYMSCKKDKIQPFSIPSVRCLGMLEQTCSTRLVENIERSSSRCKKRLIQETIVLNIVQDVFRGLDSSGKSLTISGDNSSSVTVELP